MDKQELWEDLMFEIASTKIIKLNKREEKVLLGIGDKSSELMFIGDDPNLYENGEGETKKESSGEFFLKLCELVGLDKNRFYLTNIVKCNAKLSELSDEEVLFYKEILEMEIALVNPKIIVTLGKEVAKILFDEDRRIDEIRGQALEWKGGIKVVPIHAPSYLLKNEDKQKGSPRWFTWQDLKMIKGGVYENQD